MKKIYNIFYLKLKKLDNLCYQAFYFSRELLNE